MEVAYNTKALADIDYWKKTNNIKIQKKINTLIDDILLHPFTGIGKPEALKHQLTGKWSRRIDQVNRIIYTADEDRICVYSLKGHY